LGIKKRIKAVQGSGAAMPKWGAAAMEADGDGDNADGDGGL
jgi:hypothetical protein